MLQLRERHFPFDLAWLKTPSSIATRPEKCSGGGFGSRLVCLEVSGKLARHNPHPLWLANGLLDVVELLTPQAQRERPRRALR
jgi:hypothetical protein